MTSSELRAQASTAVGERGAGPSGAQVGNRVQVAVRLLALFAFAVAVPPAAAQERTSKTDERMATWLKRFPAADANQDGVLTMPEVEAFRTQRQAQRDVRATAKALEPTLANVKYGSHPRNVLDLFKTESETATPVLIFFHGGGFVAGDKKAGAAHRLSRQCVDSGISVVSANYRFVRQGRDGAPAEPFPGPMLDCARVVQFVRSKADEWNIDPDRVALSGGSAGAVISLWIALNDDLAEPDSADPVARLSTRVSCAVPYNGPTSLDPKVILKHVGGNAEIHPSLKPFYGVAAIEEVDTPAKQQLARDASALSHVSADDPPLYLTYGGDLASAPLPADASFGKSIHHPMFGKLLKDKCDELGVTCHFACRDIEATMDEFTFLKQVFGMDGE